MATPVVINVAGSAAYNAGSTYSLYDRCTNASKLYEADGAIGAGAGAPTHSSGTVANWVFKCTIDYATIAAWTAFANVQDLVDLDEQHTTYIWSKRSAYDEVLDLDPDTDDTDATRYHHVTVPAGDSWADTLPGDAIAIAYDAFYTAIHDSAGGSGNIGVKFNYGTEYCVLDRIQVKVEHAASGIRMYPTGTLSANVLRSALVYYESGAGLSTARGISTQSASAARLLENCLVIVGSVECDAYYNSNGSELSNCVAVRLSGLAASTSIGFNLGSNFSTGTYYNCASFGFDDAFKATGGIPGTLAGNNNASDDGSAPGTPVNTPAYADVFAETDGTDFRQLTTTTFRNSGDAVNGTTEDAAGTDWTDEASVIDIGFQFLGVTFKQTSSETLGFALAETAFPIVVFSDAFAFAEALTEVIDVTVSEALEVRERHQRNSNSVTHDLVINNVAMTEADFERAARTFSPVGYNPKQTLIPGDYDYQQALVGVVVRALVSDDQVGFRTLIHNVDVPDVTDRGTETIASAATASVTFAKTFHAIPEIGVSSTSGGVVAVPQISNLSVTGFDVTLYDATDGFTVVTGAVSWTAIGY